MRDTVDFWHPLGTTSQSLEYFLWLSKPSAAGSSPAGRATVNGRRMRKYQGFRVFMASDRFSPFKQF